MLVLITYDVSTIDPGGARRLRRVSRHCQNYGQRVQNSVFECLLDPVQYELLKGQLKKEINEKTDSLRFYLLGKNWKPHIETLGVDQSYDPEGSLIL